MKSSREFNSNLFQNVCLIVLLFTSMFFRISESKYQRPRIIVIDLLAAFGPKHKSKIESSSDESQEVSFTYFLPVIEAVA